MGGDELYPIVNVKEWKGNVEEAVLFFWKQWGSPSNYHFYRNCMEHSLGDGRDVPALYVMSDGSRLIGSYALLRTDLVSRQDLTPWFACFYVDPEYRGKQLGTVLQNHAFEQAKGMGYRKI